MFSISSLRVRIDRLHSPRITKEMELVLTAGTAALSGTKPKRDFLDVASVARSKAFTDRQSKFLEMKLAGMAAEKRREILVEDVSKFLLGVDDLGKTRSKIDDSFGEEIPQVSKAYKTAGAPSSLLGSLQQAAQNAYNQGMQNSMLDKKYEMYEKMRNSV